jgi:hypothetical protein
MPIFVAEQALAALIFLPELVLTAPMFLPERVLAVLTFFAELLIFPSELALARYDCLDDAAAAQWGYTPDDMAVVRDNCVRCDSSFYFPIPSYLTRLPFACGAFVVSSPF